MKFTISFTLGFKKEGEQEVKQNAVAIIKEIAPTCPTTPKQDKSVPNYVSSHLRICKICGKEIRAKYKWRVCSPECNVISSRLRSAKYAQRKRLGLPPPEKKCVICGAELTDQKNRKYCSIPCRKKGLRKLARKYYRAKNPLQI